MASSLFNILSLLGFKDSNNNTPLDYAKAYSKQGGDFNNPNAAVNSNIDTGKALGAGLLNMGANAAKNNSVSSIGGGMVSGFYVPGAIVKRSPLTTALNYINDVAKGAIGNAQSQSDDISKAKTFGNALALQQKQREEDEALDLAKASLSANTKKDVANANNATKENVASIANGVIGAVPNQGNNTNSQPSSSNNNIPTAGNTVNSAQPPLSLKQQEIQSRIAKNKATIDEKTRKHELDLNKEDAAVDSLIRANTFIADRLDRMGDDFFGNTVLQNLKRKFVTHTGTKEDGQDFADIEQQKARELGPMVKGVTTGQGNKWLEQTLLKSLINEEASKRSNAISVQSGMQSLIDGLSSEYKAKHPEKIKQLQNILSRYDTIGIPKASKTQATQPATGLSKDEYSKLMGK